jgi:SPX domain protein involved in polyphosphate accumulation
MITTIGLPEIELQAQPAAPLIKALADTRGDSREWLPWVRPAHSGEGRYELKFTVPLEQGFRVDAWIQVHRAGFCAEYSPRRVNSLYFDTYELAAHEQNLAGQPDRAKLRIRWYGDPQSIERGVLELKRKQGALGWKECHALTRAIDLGTTWPRIVRELRANLAPRPRFLISGTHQPVIINQYERSYFASADGIVRLTVDRNITAYDQRFSARPNLRRSTPLSAQLVVELKCPASARRRLADIAADFPLRTNRCSKYSRAAGAVTR